MGSQRAKYLTAARHCVPPHQNGFQLADRRLAAWTFVCFFLDTLNSQGFKRRGLVDALRAFKLIHLVINESNATFKSGKRLGEAVSRILVGGAFALEDRIGSIPSKYVDRSIINDISALITNKSIQ